MKKTKKHRKNFASRLDLCCGKDQLRPAFQCVHFFGGFAFATNAYVLIMQDLKMCGFTEEEMAMAEGKAIHSEAFKQLYKSDTVKVTEAGIEAGDVLCKWATNAGTPPDFVRFTSNLTEDKYTAQPTNRHKT